MDDSGDRFFDNHVIDMLVHDDDNELLMMVTLLMDDNTEKATKAPGLVQGTWHGVGS
jgi:hypothetical protein